MWDVVIVVVYTLLLFIYLYVAKKSWRIDRERQQAYGQYTEQLEKQNESLYRILQEMGEVVHDGGKSDDYQ